MTEKKINAVLGQAEESIQLSRLREHELPLFLPPGGY